MKQSAGSRPQRIATPAVRGCQPHISHSFAFIFAWIAMQIGESEKLAEGVGFEPTKGCPLPVFKTGAFDQLCHPSRPCHLYDYPMMLVHWTTGFVAMLPHLPQSRNHTGKALNGNFRKRERSWTSAWRASDVFNHSDIPDTGMEHANIFVAPDSTDKTKDLP